MNILKQLEWRYATKAMNGRKLNDDKRNTIIESIRLAPTSLGLQPFHIIVIKDQATKEALLPAMNNQPQVMNSDSLIILASYTSLDSTYIENYMSNISATRQVELESTEPFKNMINGFISRMDDVAFKTWSSKQAYIGLGFGLVAAAIEEVDSTPMEGYNADQVDAILGLKEKNLTAAVILTLGYRDEDKDYLNGLPKVRKSHEDMVTYIG